MFGGSRSPPSRGRHPHLWAAPKFFVLICARDLPIPPFVPFLPIDNSVSYVFATGCWVRIPLSPPVFFFLFSNLRSWRGSTSELKRWADLKSFAQPCHELGVSGPTWLGCTHSSWFECQRVARALAALSDPHHWREAATKMSVAECASQRFPAPPPE